MVAAPAGSATVLMAAVRGRFGPLRGPLNLPR
jgi:hypothetical protein